MQKKNKIEIKRKRKGKKRQRKKGKVEIFSRRKEAIKDNGILIHDLRHAPPITLENLILKN